MRKTAGIVNLVGAVVMIITAIIWVVVILKPLPQGNGYSIDWMLEPYQLYLDFGLIIILAFSIIYFTISTYFNFDRMNTNEELKLKKENRILKMKIDQARLTKELGKHTESDNDESDYDQTIQI